MREVGRVTLVRGVFGGGAGAGEGGMLGVVGELGGVGGVEVVSVPRVEGVALRVLGAGTVGGVGMEANAAEAKSTLAARRWIRRAVRNALIM